MGASATVKKLLYRNLPLERYLCVVSRTYLLGYRCGLLRLSGDYAYQYFLPSIVSPGDTVIDIGANLGYYTTIFSRCTGPQGHVHAVEPVVPIFSVLRRNTSRLKNVTIYNCALGATDRTVAIGNNTVGQAGYFGTGRNFVADDPQTCDRGGIGADDKTSAAASAIESGCRIDAARGGLGAIHSNGKETTGGECTDIHDNLRDGNTVVPGPRPGAPDIAQNAAGSHGDVNERSGCDAGIWVRQPLAATGTDHKLEGDLPGAVFPHGERADSTGTAAYDPTESGSVHDRTIRSGNVEESTVSGPAYDHANGVPAGPELQFTSTMCRGSQLFAGLDRIDFIKCDIEGYELVVLNEMMPLITRHRPVMLVETAGDNRRSLLARLGAMDYDGYTLEKGRLRQCREDGYADIFFLPRERCGKYSKLIDL